jgi:hypothetical protein
MSESYEPRPDPLGGPISRPDGDGLPPVGGAPPTPGEGDEIERGLPQRGGDRGQDAGGGMAGEG